MLISYGMHAIDLGNIITLIVAILQAFLEIVESVLDIHSCKNLIAQDCCKNLLLQKNWSCCSVPGEITRKR